MRSRSGLLVAFAQQADALLKDLGRSRSEFWDSQLEVVDALLADASDKVKHRVDVMFAGARARFEQRYGKEPAELIKLVQRLEGDREFEAGSELRIPCPVCKTPAALFGTHEVEPSQSGPSLVKPIVRLDIDSFSCRICGLRLRSRAEMIAAGLWTRITMTLADSTD